MCLTNAADPLSAPTRGRWHKELILCFRESRAHNLAACLDERFPALAFVEVGLLKRWWPSHKNKFIGSSEQSCPPLGRLDTSGFKWFQQSGEPRGNMKPPPLPFPGPMCSPNLAPVDWLAAPRHSIHADQLGWCQRGQWGGSPNWQSHQNTRLCYSSRNGPPARAVLKGLFDAVSSSRGRGSGRTECKQSILQSIDL